MNKSTPREPIAVIGIGCRFPGAENADAFWRMFMEDGRLTRATPAQRLDLWKRADDLSARDLREVVAHGGYLEDLEAFDAGFFKVSPTEAEGMDPQQRLLLETAYHAIEDAGYAPLDLPDQRVGVFMGAGSNYYQQLLQQAGIPDADRSAAGLRNGDIANRISYFLDLSGPSEVVDAACSSGLCAIHHAIRAIQQGDCEMALAGAVNVIVSPYQLLPMAAAQLLSSDGQTRPFDRDARGFVRSEGVGVIWLKPLGRALADQDHVYGVIYGSAVNHNGKGFSLGSPNPKAQADVICQAFRRAGVSFADISYIEAHGSATELSDTFEIAAYKRAYSQMGDDEKRAGKTMISTMKGHTGNIDTANGIAAVIKVLMALQHHRIPGIANLHTLHPSIHLAHSPFTMLKDPVDWRVADLDGRRSRIRLASVHAFGFGGVNANLVIGDANREEMAKRVPVAGYSFKKEHYWIPAQDAALRNTPSAKRECLQQRMPESPEVILAFLCQLVAEELQVADGDVDGSASWQSYGLDSLTFMRIVQRVNRTWNLNLKAQDLLGLETLHAIAEYIVTTSRQDGSEIHAPRRRMPAERPVDEQRSLEDFNYSGGREETEIAEFCTWREQIIQQGVYPIEVMRPQATKPEIRIQRQTGERFDVINFANYDYLGYATHPEVIQAAKDALDRYGLGATASPIISGMLTIHQEFEATLLEFFGLPERGITLFTSGYAAIFGPISAYLHQGDHVILDSYAHASIVDGATFSNATIHFYRHNDMDDLESILRAIDTGSNRMLICTEGVFSADGDFGDLRNIVRLAQTYGAKTFVDEAHSLLLAGPNGRGACEELSVLDSVDMLAGTFSKSFSGIGGFFYAKKELAKYVSFYARNRMFSCALDPGVTGGMLAALRLAMGTDGQQRRKRLRENAAFFSGLLQKSVTVNPSGTWIVPVIFGSDALVFPISDFLQQHGLECSMLGYPAVPKNQARIRHFLTSEHTQEQLTRASEIIQEAARVFDFALV